MNDNLFSEYCAAMGVNAESAELSFRLPHVHEGVLHFRAFCLAEMLIKRINHEQITWAEVKNVFTYSDDKIYALIQFNSCSNAFPLEIPITALSGTRELIEESVSRVLKELPERIRVWLKVTKHGFKKITIREFSMKLKGRTNYARS